MNAVRILRRTFSTSVCLCGKRSRQPFDRRFPVSGRQVGPTKPGGSKIMAMKVRAADVPPTGYVSRADLKFMNKKEMIPEFIVPDLTGFQLKPYVPYNVTEIIQPKLTAKALFNVCYAEDITEKFKTGKITPEEIELILDEGTKINQDSDETKSDKG